MTPSGALAPTSLASRVREGAVSIGIFVNLGSPLATEICALAGFDWLMVDLEHGAGGEDVLLSQLHAAAGHGVPVVARVESLDRIRGGRVLDLGAHGVMLPRLETAEAAGLAVQNLRYPPAGQRGVATYNRARRFGRDLRTLAEVDESILTLVQIENPLALNEVEKMAQFSGADVLFVGPSDLSVSMGLGGRLDSEPFQAALRRTLAAADAAGIAAGILAPDIESARRYLRQGFRFLAVSSDASLLCQAACDVMDSLKAATAQAPAKADGGPAH